MRSSTPKAKASPVQEQTITQLYRKFERAYAVMMAQKTSSPRGQKAFDTKVAKCSDLASEIVVARADSIREMLLKIRVAGWAIGCRHKRLEDLDNWQPDNFLATGEEHSALASLRGDLQRVCGGLAGRRGKGGLY
jgi:hypothetical protein